MCDGTRSIECVGPAGSETCQRVSLLARDAACVVGDTANPCDIGLQCADDVDGLSRCLDLAAEVCETALPADVDGVTRIDFATAFFDGVQAQGCFEFGLVDVVTTYTTGPAPANLDITLDGFGTAGANAQLGLSVRTACGDLFSELTCSSVFPGLVTVVASQVPANTTLFVVASADRSVLADLRIDEFPIVTLAPGADCTPDDVNAICASGTACLGGPAPRAFTCTTATSLDLGNDCLVGATDRVCDDASFLFCQRDGDGVDSCQDLVDVTSAVIPGRIDGDEPTSEGRLASACDPQDPLTRYPFEAFVVSNNSASQASIGVDTSAGTTCAGDSVLGVFTSFDPESVGAQCINSDDDGGDGACSALGFALLPGTSATVVVWSFFNVVLPYTLELRSDRPVTIAPR